METFKRLPFQARQSVFQKLEQIVDIASLSKEERDLYDESIKVYRDNLAVRAYAVAEAVPRVVLWDWKRVVPKAEPWGLPKVVPKLYVLCPGEACQ